MTNWRSPEQMLTVLGAIAERYGPGDKVPVESPSQPLAVIVATTLAGGPTPVRAFLDSARLFPMRNVTMLSGDGGTGKSLLALQLAAAVAAGTWWLGIDVGQGPAVYLSAEDDPDEMHIRLKDICLADGLDLFAMRGLELAVLAGKDAVLAVEAYKGSKIDLTPLFGALRSRLALSRPRLLVLDNLADVFAGNENVRPLARQFIGALRGLAIDFDCVVLLLAHPSLSGLNSGSGTSGNTAWSNSVRSRLYLMRVKDENGPELDPNVRALKTMKANYGPTDREFKLRWEAGRFTRTDAIQAGSLDASSKAQQAERVFLQLLRWHAAKGINVSAYRSSSYAPAVFARHPQSEGVGKNGFEKALAALLEQDRVAVQQVGPPSKRRHFLVARAASGEAEDGP